MIGYARTTIDKESILDHFGASRGSVGSDLLDNVAYHLMRMILQQSDFESLETLIEFCSDPQNLCRWLPSEADRVAFAKQLLHGLQDLAGEDLQRADAVLTPA